MEEGESSGVTRTTTEGGDADSDDEDEDEQDTDSLSGDIDEVVAEEREIAQSIGHVRATEIMPTARVVGIIRRNWREYCGVLMTSQVPGARRHLFTPADRRIPRIRLETRQADILSGQRIVVAIDQWPRDSRYPIGHYVRTLGKIGDKTVENEVLLIEHDVPHEPFNDDVLKCLPLMPWQITDADRQQRVDCRHLDICSVDPPGCTDIDDALHCRELGDGRYEIGVHIADVSHFVRCGSGMDKEASVRGTTVYLTDRRIDMLPDLLSGNLCSLRSGEERFAFSVIWTMDADANAIDVRYHKSIIKSRAALTYQQAQDRIDDQQQQDALTKSLRNLLNIAAKLRKRRRGAGALTLASMEIRFQLDSETHEPIAVQEKKPLDTHWMVEEFMLLANISVAEKIRADFPDCAVLRRHPVPPASNYKPVQLAAGKRGFQLDIGNGKALADSLDKAHIPGNPFFNTMLRMLTTRCMTQAVYFVSGTVAQELYVHFGLAVPIYTHFTSPIRRYADLMVHRLLAAAIDADDIDPSILDKRRVQQICSNLNYRHKQAQYAGRASVLLNTHLFFKDKCEVLDAYILCVRRNAVQLIIPKYGLETAMLLQKQAPFTFDDERCTLTTTTEPRMTLQIFDQVKVQVSLKSSADEQHHRLLVELIEPRVEGFSVEPRLLTSATDDDCRIQNAIR